MYTYRERAALAWAESVTLVSETHVPDDVFAEARKHFEEMELVNLTLAVVAINGWMEIAWYQIPAMEDRENAAPGNCSAFVATGSWTKDGGIVMGHNAWVDYAVGERWNLVLDIVPVLLRDGERLFDDVPEFHAEVVDAATSRLATHVVYKIK